MNARLRLLVVAIGVAQIVSWGPLFYAMAVLWPRVGEDLGQSRVTLFAVVSLALLVNGLLAPWGGRAIDRHGGRPVMALGSAIAGLGLAVVAVAPGLPVYALGWALGGAAMSMVLYDPAFATLSQHSGDAHRRAVTAVTLFGGLASTAFWPLTAWLLERYDWRGTFLVFAAMQWAICLPLHALAIPRLARRGAGPEEPAAAAVPAGAPAATDAQRRIFRWLALAFALHAFLMSAMAVNLMALLQARGLTLGEAVLVGALMGPMQVAGRLIDAFSGGRIPARPLGIGALAVISVALLLLVRASLSLPEALLIVGLYGAGNGLITIARGMNVAEIFGREHYGYWLGRIGRWVYTMWAVAPLALGLLLGAGLDDLGAAALFAGFAIAALACYWHATHARLRNGA